VRLLRDEVDDALERLALADRYRDRHRGAAEGPLDSFERALERGVVAVHAVDDDQTRQPALLGVAPDLLRLHLDARHRVDHDERRFGHAQRRARLGQEVRVAGRVDQVDLGLLPLHERERREQADLSLDLVGIEVRHRRAFVDATDPVDGAGVEEQGGHERGLSATSVAHHRHVADVRGVVHLHAQALRVRFGSYNGVNM
jgi:hypothetical protein